MESKILKPTELCDASINAGCGKTKLTTLQQSILGIMAGAYIAIGGIVSAVASHSITNFGVSKLVGGALFPIGLVLVIICGAELFTGNCLMIVPKMDGKISFASMFKNWVIVYFTNFIGAIIIAFLVYQAGVFNMNSGKLGGTVIKVASAKGSLPFWTAFSSGILCNFLVCLAVWGATAAKEVAGKVVMAWFPVMVFVICGFEHCVANMYFLTAGIFAKSNAALVQASGLSSDKIINGLGIIHNLIPVTLGNIVGGAVFVGMAYYAAYKYAPAKAQKQVDVKQTV